MDKAKAIHELWSSFGLTAYDQNTVPENAQLPYITYSVATDSIGSVVVLSGSLWYRSTSWKEISELADVIEQTIGEHGFYITKVDGGYMWVTKGHPFAQRMSDPDGSIRRIYINLNAEFLTA